MLDHSTYVFTTNVRIDKPVADNYDGYKDGILGSRLEILHIADGHRKVIRESAGRFEAPNWMPDGKNLLINESGSIFKIPVDGGTPEKVNTGFADRNNNDHGISSDGKFVASGRSNGAAIYDIASAKPVAEVSKRDSRFLQFAFP